MFTSAKEHIDHLFKEKASCDANSTTLSHSLQKDVSTGFKGQQKFIYELLQNADDASENNRAVTVKFALFNKNQQEYLVFSHTGKHFSETDVEKLTNYAQQEYKDKAKDASKIGYKGIGFKAIFSITDYVHIVSNSYSFRFDKNYSQWHQAPKNRAYPWPIIPIWTEQKEIPKFIETSLDSKEVNFIIKVNRETSVIQDLAMLETKPEIMLFLKNVKTIRVHNHQSISTFVINIQNDIETISCNEKPLSSWIKYPITISINTSIKKQLAQMDDYQCPTRLKEADKTQITFAAKLDQQRLSENKNSILYCYLPTAIHTGLPYLVNADFLLNPERSHLQDNIWNAFLLELIAYFQFKWFAALAEHDSAYRYQFLILISQNVHIESEKYNQAFNKGLERGLREIDFIPCSNQPDKLLKTTNATLDETGFYNIVTEVKPSEELIDNRLSHISRLHRFIKSRITPEVIIRQLPYFAQQKQSISCQKQLFLFLKDKTDQITWRGAQEQCFILAQSSTLAKPSDIYFQDEKEEKTSFPQLPAEIIINYLHPSLIEPAYVEWITKLGAQKATPKTLFDGAIMNFLKTNKMNDRNIIPITLFIFKLFKLNKLSYENFKDLKKYLLVITKKNRLISATATHLANQYNPALRLEDICEDDVFISDKYLTSDAPHANEWKSFFTKLGVKENISFYCQNISIAEARKEKGETFDQYLAYLRNTTPKIIGAKRIYAYDIIYSFLDCNIIRLISAYPILAKLFWHKIPENWSQIQAGSRSHYSRGSFINISYLQFIIKNTACVQTLDGKMLKAQDCFSSKFKDLKDYIPIVDISTSLTDEQAEYFGINTKLSFETCLSILEKLSSNKKADINAYATILRTLLELKLNDRQIAILQTKHFKLPSQSGNLKSHQELNCFNLDINLKKSAPPRSEFWLREFPNLTRPQLLTISQLFNIKIIDEKSIPFEAVQAIEKPEVKEMLAQQLPLIARVESAAGMGDEQKILNELQSKLNSLTCFSAHRLSYNFGNAADQLFAYLDNKTSTLYFKNNWNNATTIDDFCAEVSVYFDLTTGTAKDLRQILEIDKSEISDWLAEHNCAQTPLCTLSQEVEQKQSETKEEKTDVEALIPDFQNLAVSQEKLPQSQEMQQTLTLPVNANLTPKTAVKFMSVEPEKVNIQSLTIKHATTRLAVTASSSASEPDSKITSPDVIEQQTYPVPNLYKPIETAPQSAIENKLTSVEKSQIGRWGEHIVFLKLRNDYQKKYPKCSLQETKNGFKLAGLDNKNEALVLEIIWHNKHSESGASQDFTIIKNGRTRVIEVKSTTSSNKSMFYLSKNEYQIMKEFQDRYRFFRVYNAGSENSRIEKIKNPAKLIEEGSLVVLKYEIAL